MTVPTQAAVLQGAPSLLAPAVGVPSATIGVVSHVRVAAAIAGLPFVGVLPNLGPMSAPLPEFERMEMPPKNARRAAFFGLRRQVEAHGPENIWDISTAPTAILEPGAVIMNALGSSGSGNSSGNGGVSGGRGNDAGGSDHGGSGGAGAGRGSHGTPDDELPRPRDKGTLDWLPIRLSPHEAVVGLRQARANGEDVYSLARGNGLTSSLDKSRSELLEHAARDGAITVYRNDMDSWGEAGHESGRRRLRPAYYIVGPKQEEHRIAVFLSDARSMNQDISSALQLFREISHADRLVEAATEEAVAAAKERVGAALAPMGQALENFQIHAAAWRKDYDDWVRSARERSEVDAHLIELILENSTPGAGFIADSDLEHAIQTTRDVLDIDDLIYGRPEILSVHETQGAIRVVVDVPAAVKRLGSMEGYVAALLDAIKHAAAVKRDVLVEREERLGGLLKDIAENMIVPAIGRGNFVEYGWSDSRGREDSNVYFKVRPHVLEKARELLSAMERRLQPYDLGRKLFILDDKSEFPSSIDGERGRLYDEDDYIADVLERIAHGVAHMIGPERFKGWSWGAYPRYGVHAVRFMVEPDALEKTRELLHWIEGELQQANLDTHKAFITVSEEDRHVPERPRHDFGLNPAHWNPIHLKHGGAAAALRAIMREDDDHIYYLPRGSGLMVPLREEGGRLLANLARAGALALYRNEKDFSVIVTERSRWFWRPAREKERWIPRYYATVPGEFGRKLDAFLVDSHALRHDLYAALSRYHKTKERSPAKRAIESFHISSAAWEIAYGAWFRAISLFSPDAAKFVEMVMEHFAPRSGSIDEDVKRVETSLREQDG